MLPIVIFDQGRALRKYPESKLRPKDYYCKKDNCPVIKRLNDNGELQLLNEAEHKDVEVPKGYILSLNEDGALQRINDFSTNHLIFNQYAMTCQRGELRCSQTHCNFTARKALNGDWSVVTEHNEHHKPLIWFNAQKTSDGVVTEGRWATQSTSEIHEALKNRILIVVPESDAPLTSKADDGDSKLHAACQELKNLKLIEVPESDAPLTSKADDGDSKLHAACQELKNLKLIEVPESDAPLTSKADDGDSKLHAACQELKNLKLIEVPESDAPLTSKADDGDSKLHAACQELKNLKLIEVPESDAPLTSKADDGDSKLHAACQELKNLKLIEVPESDAPLTSKADDGDSKLHAACQELKNLKLIEVPESDAPLTSKADDGDSKLHAACQELKNLKLIEVPESDAPLTSKADDGDSKLHAACQELKNLKFIEVPESDAPLTSKADDGDSKLHAAYQELKNLKLIEVPESDAPLTSKADDGDSKLHAACQELKNLKKGNNLSYQMSKQYPNFKCPEGVVDIIDEGRFLDLNEEHYDQIFLQNGIGIGKYAKSVAAKSFILADELEKKYGFTAVFKRRACLALCGREAMVQDCGSEILCETCHDIFTGGRTCHISSCFCPILNGAEPLADEHFDDGTTLLKRKGIRVKDVYTNCVNQKDYSPMDNDSVLDMQSTHNLPIEKGCPEVSTCYMKWWTINMSDSIPCQHCHVNRRAKLNCCGFKDLCLKCLVDYDEWRCKKCSQVVDEVGFVPIKDRIPCAYKLKYCSE